ncbi:MAG: lysine--tRNA ligase [Gemmatimonadetes bacterium]|nr:lysine--tRNA ligase [Gemmatimonadota bacterium]MYA10237.1 lysine--tRNA ligase [Gemmatimonadota bacterium]MYD12167.1 lysine--tRNA ligase [Gemmatimonadota bacterium]MYE70970.1 lysine--tRNA ligase [Gemmatimonadota bacterium]MYI65591.1 lysine--tRNA ligase [Gemmatimonadota bacterium]
MSGRPAEEPSRVMRARMEKLEVLRAQGIEPFAYSFGVTLRAAPSVAAFEELEAAGSVEDGQSPQGSWAGRLVGLRSHGGSTFGDLEDHTGRVQVYLKRNVLGAEAYALLDLFDLGDWIGVVGHLFRTRAGQVTVRADRMELLAKSLRPLPLGKVEVDAETGGSRTYSGFSDRETRYRQRYADLAVNPGVRQVFRTRAVVVATARRFLDDLGFLEVETPVLQPIYGGASARPFVTRHNALDRTLYLRIADELYLKRLIVGGLDRVYEISKDFRNEGIDRFHNPEFTMLEFYQAFADYEEMMDLVERLFVSLANAANGSTECSFQGEAISFERPFTRISFVDALAGALGADPMELPVEELRSRAEGLGAHDLDGAGRGKLMDKLFGELVQPGLVQPTFVLDHPRELSPLAKPKRGAPGLAERFELYAAGEELANAFSELNDPIAQRARFEDQAALRAAGDAEAQMVDEDYIRALEYGLPPTGGVGVGIDRVVMLLTDRASIRDVILFPTLREAE